MEVRNVQIGRDFGQTVEILAGLTTADHVVANPSDSILAGIKVRVAQSTNAPPPK